MRWWCLVGLLMGPWCVHGAPLKSVPVIAIEYPPYVSAYMEHQGLAVYYLNQLLNAHGYSAEVSFYPPARAADMVLKSSAWVLSYYPPRHNSNSPYIMLADAQIHYGLFRLRQEDPFRWQKLTDLPGKSVIITRRQGEGGDIDMFKEAGFQVFEVDDFAQGVRALLSKRADYLITAEETGWYYIDQLKLDRSLFQFSQTYIRDYPYIIYINLENPEAQTLIDDLNIKVHSGIGSKP